MDFQQVKVELEEMREKYDDIKAKYEQVMMEVWKKQFYAMTSIGITKDTS